MIRALVADDEQAIADILELLLENTGNVSVVGKTTSGAECLQLLEKTAPDVLLVDIVMPDLSGIQVAEIALRSDRPPLIAFITGHSEYAVKAFELGAIDYIVKPASLHVLEGRIATLVERVERARRQQEPPSAALREMVARAVQEQWHSPSRKLPVKDYEQGTIRLLDPASVVYVERDGRRVLLHTAEESLPTYYTVEQLEKRLSAEGFVRANPGALINVDYLEHLIPNGDGSYDAVFKNGRSSTISVSRSRAKKLLALLDR